MYKRQGICGSTSAAMLLRWYDIYKNQKYVPSSLESGDGVDLIEHLRGYIDGDVPGSVAGDVFTGIMSYCSSQGVSHPGGFDGYNDNYVIGRVDTYGTPFLLIIHNHPTYKNHWITGYGYNISGGTCYPIVNDGWGDTNVSINPICVTDCLVKLISYKIKRQICNENLRFIINLPCYFINLEVIHEKTKIYLHNSSFYCN